MKKDGTIELKGMNHHGPRGSQSVTVKGKRGAVTVQVSSNLGENSTRPQLKLAATMIGNKTAARADPGPGGPSSR